MSDDRAVDAMLVDEALVERLTEEIGARRDVLEARIEALATRPVQIVAVTKGHVVEAAIAAVRVGLMDLGENYAQELREKAPLVPGARWHFVGRLQSNKIPMLAPHVVAWDSLDRRSLLNAVARRCPGSRVLLQVDLAGIAGRGGCDRDSVAELVRHGNELGLDVAGLMAVGPPGGPEAAREGFRWLRNEADALGLSEVSMGMSGDLEVAVAEGSTAVRVGTDLFGARPGR